jgi:hypothetical protein
MSNEPGKVEAPQDDFSKQVAEGKSSLLRDIWGFLRDEKKWWLTPAVVLLLLLGLLVMLSGTAAAPFIYTLF